MLIAKTLHLRGQRCSVYIGYKFSSCT